MKEHMCWIFDMVCRVLLGPLNYMCICFNYVQFCDLAADTFCLSCAGITLIQTVRVFWKKRT